MWKKTSPQLDVLYREIVVLNEPWAEMARCALRVVNCTQSCGYCTAHCSACSWRQSCRFQRYTARTRQIHNRISDGESTGLGFKTAANLAFTIADPVSRPRCSKVLLRNRPQISASSILPLGFHWAILLSHSSTGRLVEREVYGSPLRAAAAHHLRAWATGIQPSFP